MKKSSTNLHQLLSDAISEPIAEIINFRALRDLLVALMEKRIKDCDEINNLSKQTDSSSKEPTVPTLNAESIQSLQENATARDLLNQIIENINSIDDLYRNVIEPNPDAIDDDDGDADMQQSEQNVIKDMITLQVIDFIQQSLKEGANTHPNEVDNDDMEQENESEMQTEEMAIDERKTISMDDVQEPDSTTNKQHDLALTPKHKIDVNKVSGLKKSIKEQSVSQKNLNVFQSSSLRNLGDSISVPAIENESNEMFDMSQPDKQNSIESIVSSNAESEVHSDAETDHCDSSTCGQDKNEKTFDSINVTAPDSKRKVIDFVAAKRKKRAHDNSKSSILFENRFGDVTSDPNNENNGNINKVNLRMDSLFKRFDDFVSDILHQITHLNQCCDNLKNSTETKNAQIDKEIANLSERLENNRITSQTAVDGLRNEIHFHKDANNVKAQVRTELARMKYRNGNRQRYDNRLNGECGCNALTNVYRCICRGPRECKFGKNTDKDSMPCFCCCSFIQGTNGNSN